MSYMESNPQTDVTRVVSVKITMCCDALVCRLEGRRLRFEEKVVEKDKKGIGE